MFQDGSDGIPTDSPQTLTADSGTALQDRDGRGRRALRAVLDSRDVRPCRRRPRPGGWIPRSPSRPFAKTRAITLASDEGGQLPSREASDGRETGRGARQSRGKCTRSARQDPAPSSPPPTTPREGRAGDVTSAARAGRRRAESRGSTMRPHPFTSVRFHVLLNSLFKVLFNFPSRYLSAIGLVPVFSLRWSLPPTLGCILKQPDSREAPRDGGRGRRGLTPTPGQAPIRRTRTSAARPRGSPKHHSSHYRMRQGIRCWALPASLAVTRGILVSFFSSA